MQCCTHKSQTVTAIQDVFFGTLQIILTKTYKMRFDSTMHYTGNVSLTGVMSPATPMGCRMTTRRLLGAEEGIVSP